MNNGEKPSSPMNDHSQNLVGNPFTGIAEKVIGKIKDEPFLFVIGITALLISLAMIPTQMGSSDLRLVIIVIMVLALVVIIGNYVRMVLNTGLKPHPDLTPPLPPPVIVESREFSSMTTLEEKKVKLIRPFEARIASNTLKLSDDQAKACYASPWEFDRIVLYLQQEISESPNFKVRLEQVWQEFELIRASGGKRSLVNLHYAVRSILRYQERQAMLPAEKEKGIEIFREIYKYLKERKTYIDQGNEVKGNLKKVAVLLGEQLK